MINVNELSKDSLVWIEHETNLFSIARIVELLKESATVTVLYNNFHGIPTNFKPGTEHSVKYKHIHGITIRDFILRMIGFVDADKKGWQLMYYYGDMKLLYRHDKAKNYPSFRLMSDYQKTFTRISCGEIHRLQNIMRFLTEDMEFKFNANYYKQNGTEERYL